MKNKNTHEDGFTLIELLTVMAIVSALFAVAVPQYAAYRRKAFDTRAQNDLRSIALAEEAYFLDNEEYLSCADTACENLPGIAKLSKGVSLAVTATASGFSGTATHSKGSGTVFRWESELGGFQD